jgi:hypothetical protein
VEVIPLAITNVLAVILFAEKLLPATDKLPPIVTLLVVLIVSEQQY